MAFYTKIFVNQSTSIFIWKIEEDFNTLFRQVQLKDISLARLESMKSESHQKGFLAVRMLLQHIGYSDFDLYYDDFGKPYLKTEDERRKMEDGLNKTKKSSILGNNHLVANTRYISISHSFDFSCICISKNKCIGIDVEIVKPKISIIAPRFMDVKHLEGLTNEDKIKKATVIWGVKESIFKIKNEKGISFPNHIFENDFDLIDGNGLAKLRFNNLEEEYCFQFEFIENYALVCAFENQEC